MDDNELTLMVQQGLPVKMIAQELGVNPSTVYRRVRELGLPVPGPDRLPLTEEKRAELVARRLAGESDHKLSTEYGISMSAIYRVLIGAGIDICALKVEERQADEVRIDRAVQLYQANLPVWQIALETGYSASAIIGAVHKRGLPLRTVTRQEAKHAYLTKRSKQSKTHN